MKKYFILVLITLAVHSFAQDCPGTTQRTNYYGNTTATCTKLYRTWQVANFKCADKWTEYSISQFVPETTYAIMQISQKKIVADNICTNGNVYQTGDVLVTMYCNANLPLTRSVETVTNQVCSNIQNITIANNAVPSSLAEYPSIYKDAVLSVGPEQAQVFSWISNGGKIKLEYGVIEPNTGVTSIQWKDYSTYQAGTNYTLFTYGNFLPSGITFTPAGSCPSGYDSVPKTNPDAKLYFRLRSEANNGSAVSAWNYTAGTAIYYGNRNECKPTPPPPEYVYAAGTHFGDYLRPGCNWQLTSTYMNVNQETLFCNANGTIKNYAKRYGGNTSNCSLALGPQGTKIFFGYRGTGDYIGQQFNCTSPSTYDYRIY